MGSYVPTLPVMFRVLYDSSIDVENCVPVARQPANWEGATQAYLRLHKKMWELC